MADITEWVNCPECGSDDVQCDNFAEVTAYHPEVECNDCGARDRFVL